MLRGLVVRIYGLVHTKLLSDRAQQVDQRGEMEVIGRLRNLLPGEHEQRIGLWIHHGEIAPNRGCTFVLADHGLDAQGLDGQRRGGKLNRASILAPQLRGDVLVEEVIEGSPAAGITPDRPESGCAAPRPCQSQSRRRRRPSSTPAACAGHRRRPACR